MLRSALLHANSNTLLMLRSALLQATFPRNINGNLGCKMHPEIDTLIKQWLYRIWTPSSSPYEVYQNLTHVLQRL